MPKFGCQLSSISPYLDTIDHIDEAFSRLAEIDCRYVQLQGIPLDIPDVQIAAALNAHGLTCVAVQEEYPFGLGTSPERYIERALACDADYLTFSMIPPQINTFDKLKRFALSVTKIYHKAQEAGLTLTYHPAEIDYRLIGRLPAYDRLLGLLPENVQLTFCVHGSFGKVPYMQILEKYAGRMDLIHVKDSITRADGATQLMPLGEGEHNWQPILKACVQAGAQYIFTDQENWDRDAFVCTADSLAYLRSLKLP